MQVRKQQFELGMEQQTGLKLGKEYIKAVYFYPAYLTSIQNTSFEIPGWMNHRLESRLPGKKNNNNIRYESDITLIAESEEELKSLFMNMKEEREKSGLKLSIQKTKSWHPVPSLHGKYMGKQWRQ